MPKSKSKKTPRKENKLRPYRIDYFLWFEMQKDKALVRSAVVRAVTADEARETFLNGFTYYTADRIEINDSIQAYPAIAEDEHRLTILRAYRFYKKLTAQPVKKTYINIDKLLTPKKTLALMESFEQHPEFLVAPIPLRGWGQEEKQPIIIRPEDLGIKPKFGDPAPAEVVGEYSAESIEVLKGMDAKKEEPTVFIPEWMPEVEATITEVPVDPENKLAPEAFSDTSNVAAGPIAPYVIEKVKEVVASYTFPDKPLVPTADAVFDGDERCGDEVVTSRGFEVCRWHGWKYIDLRDGRCTALDSGSGYLDKVYSKSLYPQTAEPGPESRIDLDAAAPVIWDPPSAAVTQEYPDGLVQTTSGAAEGWTDKCSDEYSEPTNLTIERRPTSNPNFVWYTFAAILGLVYVYFKWVAK